MASDDKIRNKNIKHKKIIFNMKILICKDIRKLRVNRK